MHGKRTFDEIHGLLKAIGVSITIIENMSAKRHIEWHHLELVDSIHSIEHDLGRLQASLRHNWATYELVLTFVDHMKAANDQIAGDFGHPLHWPIGKRSIETTETVDPVITQDRGWHTAGN